MKDIPDLYPPGFIESELKRPKNEWKAQYMCEPVYPKAIFVPEREHVTSGVPCWCNPDTSEEGLVIHRGGN